MNISGGVLLLSEQCRVKLTAWRVKKQPLADHLKHGLQEEVTTTAVTANEPLRQVLEVGDDCQSTVGVSASLPKTTSHPWCQP